MFEVLLMSWGIFFIATRDTAPALKARRFEEPIERSKHIMRMSGSMRRSSRESAAASNAEAGFQEQPSWDTAVGGPVQAAGRTKGKKAVSANSAGATGTNRGTVWQGEARV